MKPKHSSVTHNRFIEKIVLLNFGNKRMNKDLDFLIVLFFL